MTRTNFEAWQILPGFLLLYLSEDNKPILIESNEKEEVKSQTCGKKGRREKGNPVVAILAAFSGAPSSLRARPTQMDPR